MDPDTHSSIPHRRSANVDPPEESAIAGDRQIAEEREDPLVVLLSKPAGWAVSAVATQAEIISSAALSLSSPFLSLFLQSRAAPSRFAETGAAALRGMAFAVVGAAYAVACLVFVLALAVLVGVFLVRLWVEEPVLVRRALHFDYTRPEPEAVAVLGGARGRAVPAGHEVGVSLRIVMPESGFNRDVGIFQVSAEAISSNGQVIEASTQPCMLRFRSVPVRLMRTLTMAFPLLIGVHNEAQQMAFDILKYNEGSQKTDAIKVRLSPRSGTFDLPQLYEAEIVLRSHLPRRKEVVYNWKWTFYIWVSLNVYVVLLILLFCCFKPFDVRGRVRAVDGGVDGGVERFGEVGGDLGRSRGRKMMSLDRGRGISSEFEEGLGMVDDGGEVSELVEDYGDSAS